MDGGAPTSPRAIRPPGAGGGEAECSNGYWYDEAVAAMAVHAIPLVLHSPAAVPFRHGSQGLAFGSALEWRERGGSALFGLRDEGAGISEKLPAMGQAITGRFLTDRYGRRSATP